MSKRGEKFFLFFVGKSILFGAALKTKLLPDMSWPVQVGGAVNKLLTLRPQAELLGRQFIIVRHRLSVSV